LFFLVLLDALVDLVREPQFVVDVACVRVVGVRADREVLLALVLEELLAPRRAVALFLYLLYQCPYLPFSASWSSAEVTERTPYQPETARIRAFAPSAT